MNIQAKAGVGGRTVRRPCPPTHCHRGQHEEPRFVSWDTNESRYEPDRLWTFCSLTPGQCWQSPKWILVAQQTLLGSWWPFWYWLLFWSFWKDQQHCNRWHLVQVAPAKPKMTMPMSTTQAGENRGERVVGLQQYGNEGPRNTEGDFGHCAWLAHLDRHWHEHRLGRWPLCGHSQEWVPVGRWQRPSILRERRAQSIVYIVEEIDGSVVDPNWPSYQIGEPWSGDRHIHVVDQQVLGSILVSTCACHLSDPWLRNAWKWGLTPRQGGCF